MRQVAVIGIGQTPIDEHWDLSLKDLAGEAVLHAMNDASISGFDALYIGNMMSGAANHQQNLGPLIADWVGMRFSEAYHIEAACSSGAARRGEACQAVWQVHGRTGKNRPSTSLWRREYRSRRVSMI